MRERVTSLRTGAVVGVATDLFGPRGDAHTGADRARRPAADQLRAVRAVRTFDAVTLDAAPPRFSPPVRRSHAGDLAGLDVRLSTDPVRAVADADVVCCATPSTVPLFEADVLPEVLHINAIGSYRLEHARTTRRPALVGVGGGGPTRSGARGVRRDSPCDHRGGVAADALVELGTVLDGLPGTPPPARTVFKSVGLAMQDWAIGHALRTAENDLWF